MKIRDVPFMPMGGLYEDDDIFLNPYYGFISDLGLVKYRVYCENDDWQIKKQVITPAGEKLYNDPPILIDNGTTHVQGLLVDEENDLIAIRCGSLTEPLFRYMTIEGEPLGNELVAFPEINGYEFTDIYLNSGYLIFFSDISFLDQNAGICVYDIAGNLVPDMPGPDYYVVSAFEVKITASADALYFIFSVNHYDEPYTFPMYGYDNYAQKLSFPCNASEPDAIEITSASLFSYPNPFNPETNISWNLTQLQDNCHLAIYNLKGQKVQSLPITKESGNITWNGKNKNNKQCSTGIYFLQINNGEDCLNKKILLMK